MPRAPTTTPPGLAVVMELARVMSRRRYDATLVFMATAGGEQGLNGARLHATVRVNAQALNVGSETHSVAEIALLRTALHP